MGAPDLREEVRVSPLLAATGHSAFAAGPPELSWQRPGKGDPPLKHMFLRTGLALAALASLSVHVHAGC
jgi:hypothetical protein